MFGLSIEDGRSLAAAAASLVTAAGIVVGGLWAWFRFRRTPESRAMIDTDVDGAWVPATGGRAAFVRVTVTAKNVGGLNRRLLPDLGPDEVTRVACWSLTDEVAASATARGYVDWMVTPVAVARLLASELELQPGDAWDETVLFALPTTASAARVLVYLCVAGLAVPVTAGTVVVAHVCAEDAP